MANSTSTQEYRGWVTEPNSRGTMGIIWSCFSVIFICCWSAIHPNVPRSKDSDRRIFCRKVGYAAGCLVAPEMFVMFAAGQWFDRRYVFEKISKIAKAERMKDSSGSEVTSSWKTSHSWLAVMGGFAIKTSKGQIHSLDVKSFMELLSTKLIAGPNITEVEIEEKSKGNGFMKAIATIQILYLVMELLGRAIQHLPVTTLELFTLAMVIMALVIYFFWWNKPLDIRLPTVLELDMSHVEVSSRLQVVHDRLIARGGRVPLFGKTLNTSGGNFIIAMISIAMFGACHLIGWNFEFPTSIESLLWRIASICCVALPMLIIGCIMVPEPYASWTGYPLVCFYFIVRLYLTVEVFIGLRRVPAGVYQTIQWSQFFPHI